MARRRDRDALPLEIELFDGAEGDEYEVDFGARRRRSQPASAGQDPTGETGVGDPRRPGRRRTPMWVVLGTLAGVGAVVGLGAATGGDDGTAPTTSRPARSTTTTTSATTTSPPAPVVTTVAVTEPPVLTPIVASTYPPFMPDRSPSGDPGPLTPIPIPGTPTDGAAPFGAGSTLYLWDTQRGPTALAAYDLTTGLVTDVDLGEVPGPIKAVIPTAYGVVVDAGELVMATPDGPRRVGWGDDGITDFTTTGPRIAPGPAGLVWVRTLNPASLALFDPATGRNIGRYELPLGTELIGSTASGDPVVRAADLTSYEILDDGSSVAIAEGVTTPVERGWFGEIRCEPPTECVVGLHAGVLSMSFGLGDASALERTALRFSPDGTHVAIARDGAVRILQPLGTEAVDVAFTHVATGDPVSRPTINYFRLARDLVWMPDGGAVGLLTDQGVVFVDLAGQPQRAVLIDPAAPLRYVPLAVG